MYLLTMSQLCERFGVTRWTIHRWIRDLGFPPSKRIGRRGGRWLKETVDAWEAGRVQND